MPKKGGTTRSCGAMLTPALSRPLRRGPPKARLCPAGGCPGARGGPGRPRRAASTIISGRGKRYTFTVSARPRADSSPRRGYGAAVAGGNAGHLASQALAPVPRAPGSGARLRRSLRHHLASQALAPDLQKNPPLSGQVRPPACGRKSRSQSALPGDATAAPDLPGSTSPLFVRQCWGPSTTPIPSLAPSPAGEH